MKKIIISLVAVVTVSSIGLFSGTFLCADSFTNSIMKEASTKGECRAYGERVLIKRLSSNQAIYDSCYQYMQEARIGSQYRNLCMETCLNENGLTLK